MDFGLRSYVFRNMLRRPVRSGALLLSMAALSGMLFVLGALYISVTWSVERAGARLGADAIVVPAGWRVPEGGLLLSGGPTSTYLDSDIVARVKGYRGVAASTGQLFIVSAPLACCSLADTMLVGFEPETDFTVSPWFKETLGREMEADEIVIGQNLFSEPGGRIRFFGKVFRVAAKLEATGLVSMDSAAFIPMSAAREMINESKEIPLDVSPGEVSIILIKFDSDVNPNAVALKLEFEVPGISVVMASDAMEAAKNDILGPLRAMSAMALLWWLVSLFMAGTLYGVTLEARAGELSILRALGASRSHVMAIISMEIGLLSIAGCISGILAGWLVINGLYAFIGMLVLPDGMSLVALALLSVLLCVLSSIAAVIYPVLKHSAICPADALINK